MVDAAKIIILFQIAIKNVKYFFRHLIRNVTCRKSESISTHFPTDHSNRPAEWSSGNVTSSLTAFVVTGLK